MTYIDPILTPEPTQADMALVDGIDINARMNSLYMSMPDLYTVDPDGQLLTALATGYADHGEMFNAALNLMGDNYVTTRVQELEAVGDAGLQESMFYGMDPWMQNTYRTAGYIPPSERPQQGGQGWLERAIGYAEGFVNSTARGLDPTGTIEHGPFDGIAPEFADVRGVGGALDATADVVGLPGKAVTNTIGGILHVFDAGYRTLTRLYRTYDLAIQRSVFGDEGVGAWSPDSLREMWTEVSDGEETFRDDSRHAAAQILGVEIRDFDQVGSDLWLAKKIAGHHTWNEIADEAGYELGSIESQEFIRTSFARVNEDDFQAALNVLQDGKVSFGRNLARSFNLDPNEGVGQWVSGTGDAAFLIVLDPANLVGGGVAKARRGARWAINGIHDVETLARYREMATFARILDESNDYGIDDALNGLDEALWDTRIYRDSHFTVDQETGEVLSSAAEDLGEAIIREQRRQRLVRAEEFPDIIGRNLGLRDRTQARRTNNMIDRITEAFTRMDVAEASGNVDDIRDADRAFRKLELAKPKMMAAFDDMLDYHRQARAGGARGLADYDGVWDYLEDVRGRKSIISTRVGGVRAAIREIPQFSWSDQVAETIKTHWDRLTDPARNVDELEGIDDIIARLDAAVADEKIRVLPGGVFRKSSIEVLDDGVQTEGFDEFLNWTRRVNKGTIRRFARSMFHHVPRESTLALTGRESITEFRRLVNAGALGRMSQHRMDEYVARFARGTKGERMLLVEQFLGDVFYRTGMVGTDTADDAFWRQFVGKHRQAYSIFSNDELRFHGIRSKGGLFLDKSAEMSDVIAIPDFRQLALHTRDANRNRALWGRSLNGVMMDKAVTKVWTPLQLLRIGFIPRAAGEEIIAFMLRTGGPGEYLRSKAAFANADLRRSRHGGLVHRGDTVESRTLFGNDKEYLEFYEAAALRPVAWLTHQINEWAGFSGDRFIVEARRRAVAQHQNWDTLPQARQLEIINETARGMEQARGRLHIAHWNNRVEQLSMRLGNALHEMQDAIAFIPSKQNLARVAQISSNRTVNGIARERFANAGELERHVAEMMLTDPTIARAIADYTGSLYNPYLNATTNPGISTTLGGTSVATPAVLELGIDPSNFRFYNRLVDRDQFYFGYSAVLEKLQRDPVFRALADELRGYLPRHERRAIDAALNGTGFSSITDFRRRLFNMPQTFREKLHQVVNEELSVDALLEFGALSDTAPFQQVVQMRMAGGLDNRQWAQLVDTPFHFDEVEDAADIARRLRRRAERELYGSPDLTDRIAESAHLVMREGEEVALPIAQGHSRRYVPMIDRSQAPVWHAIATSPEMQGDFLARVSDELAQRGFTPDAIAEQVEGLRYTLTGSGRPLPEHMQDAGFAYSIGLGEVRAYSTDSNRIPLSMVSSTDPEIGRAITEAFHQVLLRNADAVGLEGAHPLWKERGTVGYLDRPSAVPSTWSDMLHQGQAQWGDSVLLRDDLAAHLTEVNPHRAQELFVVEHTDSITDPVTGAAVDTPGTRVVTANELTDEMTVVDRLWSDGATTDLAIKRIAAAQAQEALDLLTTFRQGGDSVLHELATPMARNQPLTALDIQARSRFDDLPQQIYAPTVLGPDDFSPGKIFAAIRDGGFNDVISPAIGALARTPQFHRNMAIAYEQLYGLQRLHGPSERTIRRVTSIGLKERQFDDMVERIWDMAGSDYRQLLDELGEEWEQALVEATAMIRGTADDALAAERRINDLTRRVAEKQAPPPHEPRVGPLSEDLKFGIRRWVTGRDGFIDEVREVLDGGTTQFPEVQAFVDELVERGTLNTEPLYRGTRAGQPVEGYRPWSLNRETAEANAVRGQREVVEQAPGTMRGIRLSEYADLIDADNSMRELMLREDEFIGVIVGDAATGTGLRAAPAGWEADYSKWDELADALSKAFGRQITDDQARDIAAYVRQRRAGYTVLREAVIDQGMALTIPFIDDHRVRSQFQQHVGSVMPFWFAQENFIKRYARGFYENPFQLRRGQIAMNGLRNMGWIQKDQYGSEVFVMPGSEYAMRAVAPMATAVFGSHFGEVVQQPFGANLDFMFPGLGEEGIGQVTPFDNIGPVAAMYTNLAANHFPELSPVRDAMLGGLGANRMDPGTEPGSVFAQFFPTWMQKLYDAKFQDPTEMMSAEVEAMQLLFNAGQQPPENASPGEIEDYLDKVRNTARIILATRASTGFLLGASYSPMLEDSDIEISSDFRELLDAGIDYPTAVDLLVDRHGGNATAFTVFGTESASGAPIAYSQDSLNWMQDNASFIETYPSVAAWFIPPDPAGDTREFGIVERRARNQALAHDLRVHRSPREMLDAMYFSAAAEPYFAAWETYQEQKITTELDQNISDDERDARLEMIEQVWSDFKDGHMAMHPIFRAQMETTEGKVKRQNQINDLRVLLAYPDQIPESSHRDEMIVLMQGVVDYADAMNAISGGRGQAAVQLRENLRRDLHNAATAYVEQHPSLQPFYSSLIRPLLGVDNVLQFEYENTGSFDG